MSAPTTVSQSPRATRWRLRNLALLEAPPIGVAEVVVATVLLAVAGVVLFGDHVLHGGFYSDDWWLAGAAADPHVLGHSTTLGFYLDVATARFTAAFYWLGTHEIFGLHAKAHLAVAAALGVLMSAAVYALLRQLRIERVLAFAVALLTLAFPPADAVRLWATPSISQFALATWCVGALLALRAFAAPDRRRRLMLHGASLLAYALGASMNEAIVPLMLLVSPLLYLTAAPWPRALRRWLCDVPIAVVATILIVQLTTEAEEHRVRGLSGWWDQGKRFGDQLVTLFAHAYAPFLDGERWLVLVAAVVIAAAGGALARWGRPEAARPARRWLVIGGISLVAVAAGYSLYLPADQYYYPLQQGLASRVNIASAAPFALLFVSLTMLAALVLLQWASDVRRVAVAVAATYAVLLLAAFTQDLRTDMRIWERAADEQYDTLNGIKTAVPDPPESSTLFVFGEGGVVTPGLPVFFHPWELTGALRATYDEGDIAGVPIIESRGVKCRRDQVVADVVGTPQVLAAAPYGSAVFVDILTGRTDRIRDRGQCLRVAPNYKPGPFAVPNAPTPVVQ